MGQRSAGDGREWVSQTIANLQHRGLLYRISDGEVRMTATYLRWGDGIEFSAAPYKLCEGAFPQAHLVIRSMVLIADTLPLPAASASLSVSSSLRATPRSAASHVG